MIFFFWRFLFFVINYFVLSENFVREICISLFVKKKVYCQIICKFYQLSPWSCWKRSRTKILAWQLVHPRWNRIFQLWWCGTCCTSLKNSSPFSPVEFRSNRRLRRANRLLEYLLEMAKVKLQMMCRLEKNWFNWTRAMKKVQKFIKIQKAPEKIEKSIKFVKNLKKKFRKNSSVVSQ